VIRLDGKSTVEEIGVVQKDMPNFFVEAVTIADGRIYTETKRSSSRRRSGCSMWPSNPRDSPLLPGEGRGEGAPKGAKVRGPRNSARARRPR